MKPNTPKRSQTMSLSRLFFFIVAGAVTISAASVGYFALQTVYTNKLRDIWAILFLDLEQRGFRLADDVSRELLTPQSQRRVADVEFGKGGLRPLAAQDPLARSYADLKPYLPQLEADLYDVRANFVSLGGKTLLLRPEGERSARRASLQRLDGLDLARYLPPAKASGQSLSYILTRTGQLLVADGELGVEPTRRPVVQAFIAAPVRQGQLEFTDPKRGALFGFFQEVPGTNLVLFSEQDRGLALSAVRDVAVGFGGFVFFTLIATFVLVNYPINLVVRPLRELTELATEVASGKFGRLPRHSGFGEIGVLSRSFSHMSESLSQRDLEIARLMEEQKKAVHFEHELKMARSLQNILISPDKLPREAGLEIAVRYQSASQVAGDWYGYFFMPETRESVILLCDVTGHGASSALVTAMIASLFAAYRDVATSQPIEEFARRLNKCLHDVGRGAATATALLAKVSSVDGMLTYANFGHPFPLLLRQSGDCASLSGGKADCILGQVADLRVTPQSIAFSRGDLLLLYTDGLLENGRERPWSRRSLGKTLAKRRGAALVSIVDDLAATATVKDAADDFCVMGVQAA